MSSKIADNIKRNRVAYTFLVILIVAFSAYLLGLRENSVTFHTEIGPVTIAAEIADEQGEWVQGLSGRETLGEKSGMLFVFPVPDRYAFWMAGMKISLDIIFVSQDNRIVDIARDLQPCVPEQCTTVVPGSAARYVVEVNAGFAERYGLRIGDEVEIK